MTNTNIIPQNAEKSTIHTSFSISKDIERVNSGNYFWCSACLIAVPNADQSSDPRYCLDCHEVIKGDKDIDKAQLAQNQAGGWDNDKLAFITGGQRYIVSSNGATICQGGGVTEKPQNTPDSPPGPKKPVTKIKEKGIIPTNNTQSEEAGIMLQEKRGPGRPKKQDGEKITRMTAWRRAKQERQGVLAL